MHDVFISYSSYNKYIADAICHRLESGGVKCWYAPRDIPGGEEWPAAIVRAIRASRVFILIYSKESNQSKQILREVTTAVDSECVIIPFRIDESEMSNNLAYYLNTLHWLDAVSPPLESNIEQLYQRVRAVVGIGTEIEHLVQFPAAEQTTPAEVNPPEKKPKKQKRRKWLIPLFCTLLLAVGALCLLFGQTPPKDPEIPIIEFTNLSQIGKYRYPFLGSSMFSVYGESYILENAETGTLSFVKTDTGFRYLEDLDYTPKDPKKVLVCGLGKYDVVYFLEYDTNVVKIYNTKTGEWINEKGIPLELTETESILTALGYNEYITSVEDHKDENVFLIYDQKPELQCVSRAITICPDGTYTQTDISDLGLESYLAGIDKPELFSALMIDKFHNVKVLDISTMQIRDLSAQVIFDSYMPFAFKNRSVLSEDGRYFCTFEYNGVGNEVIIWDLLQKKQVFHKAFTQNYQGYFVSDREYAFLNGEDGCMYICNLETGRTIKALDAEYFFSNSHFLRIPFVFTYTPEFDAFLFVSDKMAEEGNGTVLKLTITDTSGNVLAESEELEVPYIGLSCDIIVGEDKIMLFAISQDEVQNYEDGVSTICFRSMFYYDEEGKPVFTEQ